MRLPLFALAAALALSSGLSAEEPQNKLTAEESAAGWKLLFDGKDPSASWRGFNKQELPAGWVAEEGTLFRKDKGGDIVTKDEYDSFEFAVDWKISEGGNSGVIFKVKEGEQYKNSWWTGPEAQIQDNEKGHDPQKAGWCYQLYPASVDATKPVGEWNHFVLKCEKTPAGTYHCTHTMNGTPYVDYEIGSAEWNERVAASKFKDKPDFAKAAAGHICLQDHGNPVWFRNLKIRVLK